MATKRQRIIEALYTRLVGATSALTRVHRGRVRFDSTRDTYPVISLLMGDSEVIESRGEREKIVISVDVMAGVAATLDNPGDQVELLLGEIKTALQLSSVDIFQLVGTDRTRITHLGDGGIAHEDGDDYISASVRLSVEYIETIGAPDS